MNISDEYLKRKQELIFSQAMSCEWFFFCIFGKKAEITAEITAECLANCEVVRFFRMDFESGSPAFFGEFIRASDAQRRMMNYYGLQAEGGTNEMLQLVKVEIKQLKEFVRSVLMVLYPLFLANGSEFPFLAPKEIKEEREAFGPENVSLTVQKMEKINADWAKQANYQLKVPNVSSGHIVGVLFLVRLFLAGVQKEEERLFEKIKKIMARQKGGQS